MSAQQSELEQAVIGCAMAGTAPLNLLADIQPRYFQVPVHQWIWWLIEKVRDEGVPVTVETVTARWAEIPEKNRRGTQPLYLFDCYTKGNPPTQAAALGDRLITVAARTEMAKALERAVQLVEADEAPAVVLGMIQRELAGVKLPGGTGTRLADSLDAVLGGTAPCSTGLASVDQLLGGGVRPSELYVVRGKFAGQFALQMALTVSREAPVAYVSPTQSAKLVQRRALATVSGVPFEDIISGKVTRSQKAAIASAIAYLGRCNILIGEKNQYTDIEALARAASCDGNLGGIIIDDPGVTSNEEWCRDLARRHECPVIAVGHNTDYEFRYAAATLNLTKRADGLLWAHNSRNTYRTVQEDSLPLNIDGIQIGERA